MCDYRGLPGDEVAWGEVRCQASAMWHPVTGDELPEYDYQPDERPKRKHHWGEPYAGFVFRRGTPIGKCPVDLTVEIAKGLLNEGIPYCNPRAQGPHPDRVYVVHGGVVYRATVTSFGKSYHGYPELPAELRALRTTNRHLFDRILDRAKEMGQLEAVQAWVEREVLDDEDDR